MQKTYLKYAVPIGAVFTFFALTVAGWVIRIFLSTDFAPSANVYRILVLGTIFNTVFVPLPEAMMNFIAPKRVTVCTAIGLLWVVVGGGVFIPLYGTIGAACVILSARVIVGIIIMVQAHRLALRGEVVKTDTLPLQLPGHLEEPI